jgi:DHA3 family macrolide efflux protein-like MFS transporter
MEAVEMQWVLSVDIITAIMAVGCLIPLALPQPPRKNLPAKPDYFTELRHGFRYMISWRGLSLLVILFAILTFFAAPANALLPLFVTEYFNADVIILGYLMTAHSAGLIAGGLILGAWGGFKRRIVTILVFLMVQAIAVFLFSFTSQSLLFLAIAMRFVSGLCSAMLGAPVDAILQSTVAKDMLGRVFALMNSLTGIMMPLALAVAGPVADAIGLRAIWYVSAAVIFTIAGLAFFSRDLMNIENTKTEE